MAGDAESWQQQPAISASDSKTFYLHHCQKGKTQQSLVKDVFCGTGNDECHCYTMMKSITKVLL